MRFPIVTERLSIAPLTVDDLTSFVRYRQEPTVAQFQSWDTTYSLAQGADLIASQAGVTFPAPGGWLQIGIRLLNSNELVGDLALHALDELGQFELGFSLAPEHQGRGYAKEAAGALLGVLFREHGAERVIADTDQRNHSSTKLLEKLGFVCQPEKGWTEEFKGETVRVEHFEILAPKVRGAIK